MKEEVPRAMNEAERSQCLILGMKKKKIRRNKDFLSTSKQSAGG
jgi:hypothetical protein